MKKNLEKLQAIILYTNGIPPSTFTSWVNINKALNFQICPLQGLTYNSNAANMTKTLAWAQVFLISEIVWQSMKQMGHVCILHGLQILFNLIENQYRRFSQFQKDLLLPSNIYSTAGHNRKA